MNTSANITDSSFITDHGPKKLPPLDHKPLGDTLNSPSRANFDKYLTSVSRDNSYFPKVKMIRHRCDPVAKELFDKVYSLYFVNLNRSSILTVLRRLTEKIMKSSIERREKKMTLKPRNKKKKKKD
jgi:hypothetical protein